MGIEPMTSFLPRMRSTPELRRHLTRCGLCACIVLWAEQDSNLRRLPPADLQSAPFATRDIDPYLVVIAWVDLIPLEPTMGFEPIALRLQGGSSAN